MSYQERALAIIDRLTDSKAINIRERGTLRRAILLPEKAKEGELIKAYTKGFDTGVESVKTENPCKNCDLYFKAMTKEEMREAEQYETDN